MPGVYRPPTVDSLNGLEVEVSNEPLGVDITNEPVGVELTDSSVAIVDTDGYAVDMHQLTLLELLKLQLQELAKVRICLEDIIGGEVSIGDTPQAYQS